MKVKSKGIIIILTLLLSYVNSTTFERIKKRIKGMSKMAVAGAENLTMLQAVRRAKDEKIADSILVGDAEKIKKMAKENSINIEDFEIYHAPDQYDASKVAVNLVRTGKADFYAKGNIQTRVFIRAALHKDDGLRTDKLVTSVVVMEMPDISRVLIMSDCSINIKPSLSQKIEIINNAVDVANGIGIDNPKVAALAAIEIVNSKMPQTVEANELKVLNEKGVIKNCIVDGPLSMDLAVDPNASKLKGIKNRKILGDADIVIFPDIHSANIAYKISIRLGKTKSGAVIAGTLTPLVYNSRSDKVDNKFNSIVLAAVYSQYLKEKESKK